MRTARVAGGVLDAVKDSALDIKISRPRLIRKITGTQWPAYRAESDTDLNYLVTVDGPVVPVIYAVRPRSVRPGFVSV